MSQFPPTIPKANDDEVLINQLRHGDQSALSALYDRYGSLLYSVARRITNDPVTAEEILQDTFFQLWQKSSLFDSARGSLIGWLLTITRNRAVSELRQRRYHWESSLDEAFLPCNVGGANNLQHQIARQLVAIAMSGLSDVQREAITLAYFDGLTSEEIAVRTNTPLGTAKTRLRVALTNMRKSLSGTDAPHGKTTGGCGLDGILATHDLFLRNSRQPNAARERKALRRLTRAAASDAGTLIEAFLQMAIDICQAGTVGLSFLETSDGKEVFRWTHLAGRLKKYVGGTTPRHFSPCGVTLDRDSPQLFRYPGRHFQYFNDVECPIVEGLVLPFRGNKRGTVWIVSHDDRIRFDTEDLRVMTALTEFVESAYPLIKRKD